MPKALIFDFDGLIVDTETVIYESWAEIYEQNNQTLELNTYKNCVGSDFGQFHPGLELEKRTGETFNWAVIDAEREELIRQRLEQKKERTGIRFFIEGAKEQGLELAIASSSSRNWVLGWITKLGLREHFSAFANRDDVQKIKPDPELFLKAADLLGISPSEALILEDSENGLKAATAAGIPCAIITNPITAGGNFSGAIMVAESFNDERLKKLF
ncbi:MAG: HAD family hydrolase [Verrucomicrobiales bacterium]|jgi:HAD superfamily hydrolase (TIGR01509 family)|nr:HAD family hydrolase [Verrucomicrobiales bacterium]